jgi:hypothetical protein
MNQATLKRPAPVLRDTGSFLRRSCGCGGACAACRKDSDQSLQRAPAAADVPEVLRSPGIPLDHGTRGEMERLFDHNFSRVRVHSDDAAARSANALGARAYTLGNDIAFSADAYAPRTREGRHLLAHELAHTMQQRGAAPASESAIQVGSESSPLEAEADSIADAVAAGRPAAPTGQGAAAIARAPDANPKPQAGPPQPEACGRKSNVRVPGFDGTAKGAHISAIDVSIHSNAQTDVTLTWVNLAAGTTVPANPLPGSPGAGLCKMLFKDEKKPRAVDCSNVADSNAKDSLCTPLGDFKIQGHDCALAKEPKATRVSWFMIKRQIAFHNFPSVPAVPASHGCVRMGRVTVGTITVGGADWIHDNTLKDVTTVHVHRPAGDPGPKCWVGQKKKINRPGYKPPPGSQTSLDRPPQTPQTLPGAASASVAPTAVSFDDTSDEVSVDQLGAESEDDEEAMS